MPRKTRRTSPKAPSRGGEADAPTGKRADTELKRAQHALLRLKAEPGTGSRLVPGDHVRLLIELLRPLTPEIARRWLSALLLVPAEEREAVVSRVQAAIVESYSGTSALAEPLAPASGRRTDVVFPSIPADDQAEERQIHVVFPAKQRDGFVEQVVKTYAQTPVRETPRDKGAVRKKA